MNILLFNDNPVVRKLVALSAQKTKDELSVVWSVDEIEHDEYDLLIMDDALYSDETFESIKGRVRYKSALLMATRGNAVPAGFDNIINKPFLPTDLVDMFVQIDNKLASSAPVKQPAFEPEETIEEDDTFAINLDEELPELSAAAENFEEDFDLGLEEETLGGFEEEELTSGILDQEEVQEVRELLEDAENDDLLLTDDAIAIEEIDDIELPASAEAAEEEDEFDFGSLESLEESVESGTASLETEDETALDFDDLLGSIDEELHGIGEELGDSLPETADAGLEEAEDLELPSLDDALSDIEETFAGIEEADEELSMLTEGEGTFSEEMADMDLAAMTVGEDEFSDELADEDLLASLEEEISAASAMDDSELENLELKIQEAVDELSPEDLDLEMESDGFDMDLDEAILGELDAQENEADESLGLSELDMLDERDLKLAVGEEVADEEDFELEESEAADLEEEPFEESEYPSGEPSASDAVVNVESAAPAEGVEALQALLKALANEEVAKSLKGLNISININFGNEK